MRTSMKNVEKVVIRVFSDVLGLVGYESHGRAAESKKPSLLYLKNKNHLL